MEVIEDDGPGMVISERVQVRKVPLSMCISCLLMLHQCQVI